MTPSTNRRRHWPWMTATVLAAVAATAGVAAAQTGPAVRAAAERPAWTTAATPLAGTALDTPTDDLAAIDPVVADARIVNLGEATHGTHEHFAVKNRLIRHLVERHGFDTVVFEEPVTGAAATTRYVATGAGDPAQALNRMLSFWNSDEVGELVDLLRARNAASDARPVRFLGVDVPQGESVEAVDLVVSYLKEHRPARAADAAAKRLACLRLDFEQAQAWGQRSAAERAAYRRDLGRVLDQHFTRKLRSPEARSTEFALAHTAMTTLLDAEKLYAIGMGNGEDLAKLQEGNDTRDVGMANAIASVLARDPKAKILYWAHNMHAADVRDLPVPGFGITIGRSTGALLTERFGERAVKAVGFTFAKGSFNAADLSKPEGSDGPITVDAIPAGSYEAEFSTHVGGNFLLPLTDPRTADLKTARPARIAVGGGFDPTNPNDGVVTASLPELFDAVVHTERTTASRMRSQ